MLSAVAVPKFANLKQSAEASNVLKVANDALSAIPSSYVNLVDLEETYTDATVKLEDLVSISGKGWALTDVAGATTAKTAIFTGPAAAVATLTFNPGARTVSLLIDCAGFSATATDTTRVKCETLNGSTSSTTTNLSF